MNSYQGHDPIMTHDQVRNGVKVITDNMPTYLLAMGVITRDSAFLAERASTEDGAESLYSLAESIESYQRWRKTDDAMIQAAYSRIMTVLTEVYDLFDEDR